MALLTTTEAARRCGVTGRTFLRWLSSGELTGTRTPGGHWRIDESYLIDLKGNIPIAGARAAAGVLIIEDDPSEAGALARVVSLLVPEANVNLAADGLEAGLLLGTSRPRVAFVDIEMPVLNGIEVIRRARQVATLDVTRFVVVSGRLTTKRVAELESLGVEDLLKKPVDPGAVQAVLARCGLTGAQGSP